MVVRDAQALAYRARFYGTEPAKGTLSQQHVKAVLVAWIRSRLRCRSRWTGQV